LTHPLAILLWVAAALALSTGITSLAIAIVVVITVNAIFAFVQELHAERAVEALREYLPERANTIRDGQLRSIPASELVPGDLLVVSEGDRISADARLISGALEIDASALTGESQPVLRTAGVANAAETLLQAEDLIFSGTACTEGDARAIVFATGMQTQLGRIAALSQRTMIPPSPLEIQVRRVAWLIAAIAAALAAAFIPVATLGAGLSFSSAVTFAIGLLVGNVPEGLLPMITLVLALAVRELAHRGALVKRLSAVETLGSTDVICTDKTGTLTANQMTVTCLWTSAGEMQPDEITSTTRGAEPLHSFLQVSALCSNARRTAEGFAGDPTEIALLRMSSDPLEPQGVTPDTRLTQFHFDPAAKLMSTVDMRDGGTWLDTKGAPESVLPLCISIQMEEGPRALTRTGRDAIDARVADYAAHGLRVLALATRLLDAGAALPAVREEAERDLCFLGLVGLFDPPRPEASVAVARCHEAGIRVIVISGDHPLTTTAVARSVGIVKGEPTVITGGQIDSMDDDALAGLLRRSEEIVFARSSPEAKLRVASVLKADGHVVAMTGDGANDAPALREADIGVAMGKSGTDVARESALMVLTDDDFATIVVAVAAGRRVFANIRKFIFYIFTHATPEVVPFLLFALTGGRIPLPLTVLQLLAVDIGTETAPALALGREPAEPGLMREPPRPRNEGVIQPSMLIRAWLFLGIIATILELGAYLLVLLRAGWRPGDPTGTGSALHASYREATTITFLSMVMGQVGTAFAARTEHASTMSIGILSNPALLWGIAAELVMAAAFIYAPPLQDVFGTAPLPLPYVAMTLPFPFVVWGADELRRYLLRRRTASGSG
jgi:calcium-translocating P-type ATPase